MADRYDLVTPRSASNGKTYFTKIGVMFPMKEKDGFSMSFEALPIAQMSDKGVLEVRVLAMEPYKKEVHPQTNTPPDDIDDSVPF